MALANVSLTPGVWTDVSALVETRRVFVSGGVVDLYAAPTNADTYQTLIGRVFDGQPLVGDDLAPFLKAVTVSGTPTVVCSGDNTGRVITGPLTLAVGARPTWGATLDRGVNVGTVVNVFGQPFTEVDHSPDGTQWAPTVGTDASGFGAQAGAQRYLRARAASAGSARVMSADATQNPGGPPTGPAGGVLAGTYPNPSALTGPDDGSGIYRRIAVDSPDAAGAYFQVEQVGDSLGLLGSEGTLTPSPLAGGNVEIRGGPGAPGTTLVQGTAGGGIFITGGDGGDDHGAGGGSGTIVSITGGDGRGTSDGGSVRINAGVPGAAPGIRGKVFIGDVGADEIVIGGNTVDGITIDDELRINGPTQFSQINAPIAAAGDTITSSGSAFLAVNNSSGGNITLTSTPTIPSPASPLGAGSILILANAGTNNTVLQDEAGLAGSNLRLGAATRTLGGNAVLGLIFTGNDWREMFYRAP